MRLRDHSWTIALCASLAAHAAFIDWRADRYVADHTPIRLGGYAVMAMPHAPQLSPLEPDEVGLGEANGTGHATDASPGETEMQARKGEQDQSFLSRDPEGPGKVGDAPSQSLVPPGENGADGSANATPSTPFGAQPTQQSQPQPKFPQQHPSEPVAAVPDAPDPAKQAVKSHTLLAMATPQQPEQQPSPPTPPQPAPQPTAQPTAQQSRPSPSNSAPAGKPGPKTSAADPAPQAESESDPFSVTGSAEFHRGSTKVQLGRKHRLTRPKLPWDTMYDFLGMTGSSVTLELQIDETGQVISATVVKSSGSESIDQPSRLAAYEWWFEPAKDATGKPIKDVIKFTLKFS
jgi:TonB family protein